MRYNDIIKEKGVAFMNRKHALVLIALILVLAVFCTGCAGFLQKMENSQLRSSTEAMLDALIGGDFQKAYGLVSNVCSQEEFQSVFPQLQQILGSGKTYELQMLSVYNNTRISNGEKTVTVSSVYQITTSSGRIIANVQMDDQIGLTTFQLTPYENTDYYFTGTLGHMKDANALQWVLLLLNVVSVCIGVFALVDCARKKIKNKVLWILLLVIGFATVGVSISGTSFRTNFNLGWITAYSALIRFGSGAITLRLMLPAGAIIYFGIRRSLIKAPKAAAVEQPVVEAPSEES